MIANGVARRQKPCPLYPSSRPVMGTGSVYTCIAAFGVVRCDSSHFLPSTGPKRHGVSGGATNDPRGARGGRVARARNAARRDPNPKRDRPDAARPANGPFGGARGGDGAPRASTARGRVGLTRWKQPAIRFGSDSSSRLKNKTAADLDPSRLFGVMTRRGQAGGWRLELNRTVQAYCRAAVRHRSAPPLRWRYADALLAEQSGPRSRVG